MRLRLSLGIVISILLPMPVLAQVYDYVRPGIAPPTLTSDLLPAPQVIKPPTPKVVVPIAPKPAAKKPTPSAKTPKKTPPPQPKVKPAPVEVAVGPLQKPIPLQDPVVVYPEIARAAGREGAAIVRAYIDSFGLVTDVKIMRTSGFEDLDRAAETSVRDMKFKPALRGTQAEPAKADLAIRFRLS